MTIQEFYDAKLSDKTKYARGKAKTIEEFYGEFINANNRKITGEVLLGWHKLLTDYYFKTENPVFFVRKYESAKKKNGEWNTRRGAVVRFKGNNDLEIVYSSNFLAHDIYFMALNGFVPSLEDFSKAIKDRTLRNTIGTESDKKVNLYPGNNKTLTCYLSHIVGVNNDPYLMDDGSKIVVSRNHAKEMFPIGEQSDWENEDKIYKYNGYRLLKEDIDILRAHSIRLLDPFNYFLTPQTKNTKHQIAGLKKNIGEYRPLIDYVVSQRKKEYQKAFEDFLKKARYCEEKSYKTLDICLEYNNKQNYNDKNIINPISNASHMTKTHASNSGNAPTIIFNPESQEEFKRRFKEYGYAEIKIIYDDGNIEIKGWNCKALKDESNLLGNIRSKNWYRKNKSKIVEIRCSCN